MKQTVTSTCTFVPLNSLIYIKCFKLLLNLRKCLYNRGMYILTPPDKNININCFCHPFLAFRSYFRPKLQLVIFNNFYIENLISLHVTTVVTFTCLLYYMAITKNYCL